MTLQEARDIDPNEVHWDDYFEALSVLREEVYTRAPHIRLNYNIKINSEVQSTSLLTAVWENNTHTVEVSKNDYTPPQVTVLKLHQLMVGKLEQELGPRRVQRLKFS